MLFRSLSYTLDLLKDLDGKLFKLSALFGPQHGIKGHTQDNMIEWEGYEDPELHIPVYSLYGEHREPTAEIFRTWMLCLWICRMWVRVTTRSFGRFSSE